MTTRLEDEFGNIDIYVFDQILRGRIAPGMRVLDAGCGGGRNLVYLMREGYDVCGADQNPAAIAQVRAMAAQLAPSLAADAFRVDALEAMTFPDAHADVVIMNAVLHFASDADHFERMLRGAWRVLRPGGLFFARLASTVAMADNLRPLGHGRYLLSDGSQWYLVDPDTLVEWTDRLGGALADPIKTTVVHRQRAMTTWVMRKGDK